MSMQEDAWEIPEFTAADRFRKAREKTGLDQRGFGDLAGIDKNTVTNYETGKTKRYTRAIVAQWAWAAKVPVEWLLTGDIPMGPGTPGGLPGTSSPCMTDDLAARRARRSTPLLAVA